MKINKILGALGNLDKIAEGIKNKIFKKKEVEGIARMRWAECKLCPLLDEKGKTCAVGGTAPCCGDCGCSLSLKLRSLSSSCPKGRWGAVMNGKLENKLKNQWIGDEIIEHEKEQKKAIKEQKQKMKDDSNI